MTKGWSIVHNCLGIMWNRDQSRNTDFVPWQGIFKFGPGNRYRNKTARSQPGITEVKRFLMKSFCYWSVPFITNSSLSLFLQTIHKNYHPCLSKTPSLVRYRRTGACTNHDLSSCARYIIDRYEQPSWFKALASTVVSKWPQTHRDQEDKLCY